MKSTEAKEIRERMVDMHQFFLDRIDEAIKSGRFIEASWLIYSCLENRFFRILQKYKANCRYCTGKCKKNRNELALSTKLSCVKRLCENDVPCISNSFSLAQLEEIRIWVKKRNHMMHDLLSLDTYENTDEDFKASAIEGQTILTNLYASCTRFRHEFYSDKCEFTFPEKAMEDCPCNRNNKESEVD